MKFKQIQELHKKLQQNMKLNNCDADSIVIRHWNVFYNQLRGRDLSVIEQKSNTPLYQGLLCDIEKLVTTSEFSDLFLDEINAEYLRHFDDRGYQWHTSFSRIFKIIKESSDE